MVVIGDSSGIGLETARRARFEGANVVLTGRDPQRLEDAARELGAPSSAAFDAVLRGELTRILERAGFVRVRWMPSAESGFYQPPVVAVAG